MSAAAVRSIADLPLRERPPKELLGVGTAPSHDAINLDYTGYGWARIRPIWLDGTSSPRSLERIDDALLLALHSADDAEAMVDDIELEFALDDIEPGAAVSVLLSAFLDCWLPRLPSAPAIVLALCNRHRALLRPRPAAPIFHGLGDVDAWLDQGAPGEEDRLRLVADAWRRAE